MQPATGRSLSLMDRDGSCWAVTLPSPGGVYELYIKIKNKRSNSAPNHLKVQFEYAGGSGRLTVYEGDVPQNGTIEATSRHILPLSAYRLKWVVEGEEFQVQHMEVRLMATRYRVEEKNIDGGETDDGTSESYEYDGPATNDPAHSQAVANGENYEAEYRSFRGHAASRVLGPSQDGLTRVETAWYRQDDALNGRQAGSLGMLESYHSAFESSVCGNGWSCAGSAPQFSLLEGDNALRLSDPNGGWDTATSRSSNALAGTAGSVNTALVQFRASSQPRQMGLGVDSGAWGS